MNLLLLIALSITLAWDPNPEPDIAGYFLHVRDEKTNVGNVTEYTYETNYLAPHTFGVSAYNTSGNESELSKTITFIP